MLRFGFDGSIAEGPGRDNVALGSPSASALICSFLAILDVSRPSDVSFSRTSLRTRSTLSLPMISIALFTYVEHELIGQPAPVSLLFLTVFRHRHCRRFSPPSAPFPPSSLQ